MFDVKHFAWHLHSSGPWRQRKCLTTNIFPWCWTLLTSSQAGQKKQIFYSISRWIRQFQAFFASLTSRSVWRQTLSLTSSRVFDVKHFCDSLTLTLFCSLCLMFMIDAKHTHKLQMSWPTVDGPGQKEQFAGMTQNGSKKLFSWAYLWISSEWRCVVMKWPCLIWQVLTFCSKYVVPCGMWPVLQKYVWCVWKHVLQSYLLMRHHNFKTW